MRGINVAGHKSVRMAELRGWVEALGYEEVTTYMQSGNLVFRSGQSATKVRDALRRAVLAESGFDIPVVVRTASQLGAVIDNNPFAKEAADEPKFVHVAFLSGSPSASTLNVLLGIDSGAARCELSGREPYLHFADGAGKTKWLNTVIEKTLGVDSTSRNWNSVLKLAGMLKNS